MVPKTVPFQGEVEWGLRDPNFNPLTLMREPAWPHPVFSSPTSLFVAGAPMGGRDASLVLRGSDEETGTERHLQSPQICVAMEKAPPLLSQTLALEKTTEASPLPHRHYSPHQGLQAAGAHTFVTTAKCVFSSSDHCLILCSQHTLPAPFQGFYPSVLPNYLTQVRAQMRPRPVSMAVPVRRFL